MSIQSQDEVINKFYIYIPDQTVYQKPGSSGPKGSSGKNKRRVNLPEPEVLENHLALSQSSGQDDGIQDESIQDKDVLVESNMDLLFDPDMIEAIHQNKNWHTVALKKLCPKMF